MRFWRASKQKPCPISEELCKLSGWLGSKSFSVTNARSFNPKNSRSREYLLHPQAVVELPVAVLMQKELSLFLDNPLRS